MEFTCSHAVFLRLLTDTCDMTLPKSRLALAGGALAVASLVGFGALGASAQTTTTTAKKNATSTTVKAKAEGDMPRCDGPKREPLDEATAAKVTAAAEKAVPGATVKKTGKHGDGYFAAMVKEDGTKVLVRMDKDFTVTNVKDPAPMRGHGRGHGHGRGPGGPRPGGAPQGGSAPAGSDAAYRI